ncbi:hypothetical protein L208DRAFT_1194134, partial [Tricholoma matsutake]
NIALICHGYLSASPLQPAIAFTLEALEFYHQLCRHQANFSVQAFIKVLCAIHNVHLLAFYFVSALFADALNAYLAILCHVQTLVNTALQCSPGWRICNTCPPCGYKLPGEPPLVPEWLHAMDGNNLMKRVNGSGHTDEHIFISDYLIPPSKVDTFKDDV